MKSENSKETPFRISILRHGYLPMDQEEDQTMAQNSSVIKLLSLYLVLPHMTITLENITRDMFASVTAQSTEDELDIEVSRLKKTILNLTRNLEGIDNALLKITWMNNVQRKDEVVIKGLIAMAKAYNEEAEAMYQKLQTLQRSGINLKKESKAFREAIDLQLEGVLEVERIIFDVRKDERYTSLFDLADEL